MATSFHSTQLKFQMTNESKKWWGKTRLVPVLVLIGEGPAMTLEVPSFTNEHLDTTIVADEQRQQQLQSVNCVGGL